MVVHTIKSGETLESVAGLYNVPVLSLVSANKISTSEDVVAGMDLVIPIIISSHPLIRKGHKGAAVKELQQRLVNLGYGPETVNGIFGKSTEKAVRQFQKSKGLASHGIVDRSTWEALLQEERDKPNKGETEKAAEKALAVPSTPVLPDPVNNCLPQQTREEKNGTLTAPLIDGRIFAGSSSGVLYCYDALTGQQLWSAAVEGAVRKRPAADHERVYVTDEALKLYAFEKKSGKLIWTAPVVSGQRRVQGKYGVVDIPQPVVAGNRVLVFSGGGPAGDRAGDNGNTVLLVFAAETGKLLVETAVPPKEEHYIRGYRLPAL